MCLPTADSCCARRASESYGGVCSRVPEGMRRPSGPPWSQELTQRGSTSRNGSGNAFARPLFPVFFFLSCVVSAALLLSVFSPQFWNTLMVSYETPHCMCHGQGASQEAAFLLAARNARTAEMNAFQALQYSPEDVEETPSGVLGTLQA